MSIIVKKSDVVIAEALNIDSAACIEWANTDHSYISHETLRTLRDAITEYLEEVNND